MGITANYKGFMQIAFAIYYALQDPKRLEEVTHHIYPLVAIQCNTTITAVEKNIRTVVNIVWRDYKDHFEKITKTNLKYQPGNAQFIAALTMYFWRIQNDILVQLQ